MRRIILLITFLGSVPCFGQTDFGIKGGLNFNSNGKLREIQIQGENILQDRGDAAIGYHLGIYAKFPLSRFYFRPELVFTRTNSSYEVDTKKGNYKMSKIDIPLLFGYRLIGPLNVFMGPSFQYFLSNDLDIEDISISDVKNELTAGLHLGAALEIGNVGLDVRYERGFSENEAIFISDTTGIDGGVLDARTSMLIFSVYVNLL